MHHIIPSHTPVDIRVYNSALCNLDSGLCITKYSVLKAAAKYGYEIPTFNYTRLDCYLIDRARINSQVIKSSGSEN